MDSSTSSSSSWRQGRRRGGRSSSTRSRSNNWRSNRRGGGRGGKQPGGGRKYRDRMGAEKRGQGGRVGSSSSGVRNDDLPCGENGSHHKAPSLKSWERMASVVKVMETTADFDTAPRSHVPRWKLAGITRGTRGGKKQKKARTAVDDFNFNQVVLSRARMSEADWKQSKNEELKWHHEETPNVFESAEELYEWLRPLVVLEAVTVARDSLLEFHLRQNEWTRFAIWVGGKGVTMEQNYVDFFFEFGRLNGAERKNLKPASLYVVFIAGESKGMVGMVSKESNAYNGSGVLRLEFHCEIQDVSYFASVNDRKIYAYPITNLISLQRMYEVCIVQPRPSFIHQVIGKLRQRIVFEPSTTPEERPRTIANNPEMISIDDDSIADDVQGEKEDDDSVIEILEMEMEMDDESVEAVSPGYAFDTLNASQANAIEKFISCESLADGLQIWQGPPGSGKTKAIIALLHRLIKSGKRCLVCAPSNQAVQVLMNTYIAAHRRFSSATKKETMPLVVLAGVEDQIPENLMKYFVHGKFSRWRVDVEKLRNEFDKGNASKVIVCNALDSIWHEVKAYWPKKMQEQLNELRLALETAGKAVKLFNGTKDSKLKESFASATKEKLFNLSSILLDFDRNHGHAFERDLLRKAQIVFCTLAVSGRKSIMTSSAGFDALIVDEAGQAVEAETLIALQTLPKKCLLVGDPKQLSATVHSQEAVKLGFQRSLMHRLMFDVKHEYSMLNMQYRMRPEISKFPAKHYYDGKLLDGENVSSPAWKLPRSNDDTQLHWLQPYMFIDVHYGSERHRRGSKFNTSEASVAVQIVKRIRSAYANCSSDGPEIAILSFYAAQVSEMEHMVKAMQIDCGANLIVSTVDSFQGSEADIVILSFVRANPKWQVGFLEDFRRLNVALTRARFVAILVGHYQTLANVGPNSTLTNLVKDAKERKVVVDVNDLVRRK